MKKNKHNNHFFALFFIFLLSFTAAYFSGKFLRQGKTYTIVLDDKGFSKDTVTIHQGDTVVWKIAGAKLHWPASNFHPTHTFYPESGGCLGSKLDACRGLRPGETYSFVFDKVGNWGMHDHNASGFTMMVKVEKKQGSSLITHPETQLKVIPFEKPTSSPQSQAEEDYQHCKSKKGKGISDQHECYGRLMEESAYRFGQEYAFEVMHELQKKDSGTIGCHFISHGVGWGMYKHDPEHWQQTMNNLSTECSYGALHGLLEYYISGLPDGKLTKEIAQAICPPHNALGGCGHPLGHILLVEEKGDVDRALDFCDVLGDNKGSCYHGVFMEHHLALNLILHGFGDPKRKNWSDFLEKDAEFCKKYSEEKLNACWGRLAHSIYYRYDQDVRKIYDYCNRAPNKQAARVCKQISFTGLYTVTHANLPKYISYCTLERSFDPGFEQVCYNEYVGLLLANNKPEHATEVVPFCLGLPSSFTRDCLRMVGDNLKKYHLSTSFINNFCKPVKDLKLQSLCRGTI